MHIYNSMTRRKEEFVPIEPGKVSIYACGPTVYNYFHIGNARPFITFDVLRRQLEREGYDVTFVQNFTDIDDKMIRRANEEGITVKELGERFIAEYYKDADALGIERATVNPKATEHIPEIIDIIKKLEEKGCSIPLVLHGASGLTPEAVKSCIAEGICKVNFATELRVAYTAAVRENLASDAKIYDPKKYGAAARTAVIDAVKQRIIVCGCNGKA